MQSYYIGTPLNRHPSMADTQDITDNSDCFSMDFNTLEIPEQQTPRYSV